ncbi:hypothetical protein BDQ17DRAFT_1423998 [Cyathus striatus]|nr:hypothetical protein BDQ17DRAFT_1423998 [Cyathus striatus]
MEGFILAILVIFSLLMMIVIAHQAFRHLRFYSNLTILSNPVVATLPLSEVLSLPPPPLLHIRERNENARSYFTLPSNHHDILQSFGNVNVPFVHWRKVFRLSRQAPPSSA